MSFLNIENYKESRLDGAITATDTLIRVLAGDGEAEFPDAPTVLTLTVNKALNNLKRVFFQAISIIKIIWKNRR